MAKDLKDFALSYHIPVFLPKSPITPESRTIPMFIDYLKILARKSQESKEDI